jgi:uncharacterized membrane protein
VSYYEVLLFVHVLGAAIWFGTGFALLVLGHRFDRAHDNAGLRSLFDQSDWLAKRVFIPISLVVLVAGILLVLEGPWSFDQLWIVLGLLGYAVTFFTGILVLTPLSKRIAEQLNSEGMTDSTARGIGSMFNKMRIDYTVIGLVIADMTLKPTGDDVLLLVLMAAVLVGVVALVVRSDRSSQFGGTSASETA